ncbi:archease [Tautonia sociabilis]|uniref:Archease n=1 Tax=Tautonia sociabilis TaxID=2080755 RepID=A0A432MRJ9_9BACT|nr:archease [Tautonia sociabilis]RUL89637.1 archease [Tautonia sociabilis]
MGSVEYFEHTADVGLRVRAGDLDELFRLAAEGLFDYIVVNRAEVRPEVSETVSLRADSPSELLVDWLNELIFRLETTHRLFARFEVQLSGEGTALEAAIAGEPIDRDRHVLDHEVKAVTRHEATLRREGNGWLAELILDI